MPWEECSAMERRIEFVIRASLEDANISALCKEYRIARKTGYKWKKRYHDTDSVQNLSEKSRKPHNSPNRISKELESMILQIHRLYFGMGGKKIAQIMTENGHSVSISTANRVLKSHGLVRQRDAAGTATNRFEKERPNEMWQMDLKGPFKKKRFKCTPLTLLDDHSRYVTGLHALSGTNGKAVHEALLSSFERHGMPDSILTDHGTPWWSTTNGHGLTWLSIDLIKQGIKLHFCGIRHPQTQGKVERFHRTLKAGIRFEGEPDSWAQWQPLLDRFRQTYNHVRPHESLQDKRPVDRYFNSTRWYNPNPPEWNYGPNAKVEKLNSQGCLKWNKRRFFVCEALASEWVQIEEIKDNLLIKYRNIYVREINLTSWRTIAIVRQEGNKIV